MTTPSIHTSHMSIIITSLNAVTPIKNSNLETFNFGWRIKNSLNEGLMDNFHYDAQDFHEFEVEGDKFNQFLDWLNNHIDSKAFTALNTLWTEDIAFPSYTVVELAKAFNSHLRIASQAIFSQEDEYSYRMIYLELATALNFSGFNGALLLRREYL